MTGLVDKNTSTKTTPPDYYNSGSLEASTDTALVIKRLEAVSISFCARDEGMAGCVISTISCHGHSHLLSLLCLNNALTETAIDKELN